MKIHLSIYLSIYLYILICIHSLRRRQGHDQGILGIKRRRPIGPNTLRAHAGKAQGEPQAEPKVTYILL